MFALVTARLVFVIGFLILLFAVGKGVVSSVASPILLLAYIVFCEVVVGRFIKNRASPPLTRAQRSVALSLWLIVPLLIALAFLAPAILR